MRFATRRLVILLVLGLAACGRTEPKPTTVLLVRHAEKASEAEDSPLNEAGLRRAQALVNVAEGAGVTAIYSSQYKRNRDTAQPLAERAGVRVAEAPVNLSNPGDYARTLARDILDRHAGGTVVVVGHANTVGATVEALTGRPERIEGVEYQDLFVVTVPPGGPARLIRARYGPGAGP